MYKWMPFIHMINKIKKVIDTKVKNLKPELEDILISEILDLNITTEKGILSYIRSKLNLPRQGKYTKIYWIRRGWNNEEIKEKIPKLEMITSPMKVENWLNKINDKTGKLYTEEEAKYKVKSFRKLNNEYWLERGYSLEESINKVKEYQKENSDKMVTKILNNPENYLDRVPTQLGYWIKKGFSEEEAKIKLTERQDTSSLNFLTKRYGEEEGSLKYKDRCDFYRYTSSRKYYTDKYGIEQGNDKYNEVYKNRRDSNFGKASIESLNLLLPIYNFCLENNINDDDIYFGYENKKEFFLNDNKNYLLYDFTLRNLKIIIEYHGIMFHPNPKWEDLVKENWKCLFSELGYVEKYGFDLYKEKIAVDNGFDIYTYYSDDNMLEFLDMIKIKIKEKLNNGK